MTLPLHVRSATITGLCCTYNMHVCTFDNSDLRTYVLKCSYRLEMISYGLAMSEITFVHLPTTSAQL